MSDAPQNNTPSGTTEISAAVASAQSEINTLLSDLKSKKTAFDSTAETSTKAITGEMDKAKVAGQEIATLRNEAVSAKAAMDTERNDLVAKAKAAQSEIETARNNIATIKGNLEATQKAVVADAGIVTQAKADVEKLKAEANALAEKLSKEHTDLATQISALKKTQSSLQGVLKEITDTKAAAEENGKSVNSCLEEVKSTKDKFVAISSEASSSHEALVAQQKTLAAKIAEIEDANAKITDLRRKLLESSDENKSVQDEISELRAGISGIFKEASDHRDAALEALKQLTEKADKDAQAFSEQQTSNFGELYKSLQAKIESLLPSAGAAGLSSTYYDAKSRYAPTSFGGRPGAQELKGFWWTVRKGFGYNPASVVATIVFYVMFVVPIGFIVWIFFDFLKSLPGGPHPIDVDYKLLLLRVFIALPLAAISGFGFNSLRLYRKLYEEYNHKQRVMELYLSFSREIQANGTPEQKQELLNIMLNSVSAKAMGEAKGGEGDHEGDLSLSTLDKFAGTLAKIKSIAG